MYTVQKNWQVYLTKGCDILIQVQSELQVILGLDVWILDMLSITYILGQNKIKLLMFFTCELDWREILETLEKIVFSMLAKAFFIV